LDAFPKKTKSSSITVQFRVTISKIIAEGGTFRIVDLKSANGTLVNGEEYAQTALKGGDVIELGHVKLRFIPAGFNYVLTPEERSAIAEVKGGKPVRQIEPEETVHEPKVRPP